jgi:hypothetical protein
MERLSSIVAIERRQCGGRVVDFARSLRAGLDLFGWPFRLAKYGAPTLFATATPTQVLAEAMFQRLFRIVLDIEHPGIGRLDHFTGDFLLAARLSPVPLPISAAGQA